MRAYVLGVLLLGCTQQLTAVDPTPAGGASGCSDDAADAAGCGGRGGSAPWPSGTTIELDAAGGTVRLRSSAPAMLEIFEEPGGVQRDFAFTICADGSGGPCEGADGYVVASIVIPEGTAPIPGDFAIGDPSVGRDPTSEVQASIDGVEYHSRSGRIRFTRTGPRRFSGSLEAEMVTFDGASTRVIQAAFGGDWLVDCWILSGAPENRQWENDPLLRSSFCTPFAAWME